MGIIATRLRFQSPRGEGVVQTVLGNIYDNPELLEFQSPRGEGVVQTANPQTCMVMRQTGIWIFEKHLLCFIFTTPISIV